MSRTLGAIKKYDKKPIMHTWWSYLQKKPSERTKCCTMIKIALNCHHLNACKARYECGISDRCINCNGGIETIEHVLFECRSNAESRGKYWKKFEDECSIGLKNSLKVMSNVEKSNLLISGLGNTFTKEWIVLYDKIIEFIYCLHIERVKLNANNINNE